MPVSGTLWPILVTFFTSMLPGLELRAGIPAGVALGLDTPTAVVVAVLGNILQIAGALVVIEWAYRQCTRIPLLNRWLTTAEGTVGPYRTWIRRYGWLGLALFVSLPLPGSGIWGGTVLARLLQVSAPGLWLGLSLGVAGAGIVMGLLTEGAFTIFRLF